MLLLLLSRFSCVPLCATPQTAAHQASLSLGFSKQESWGRLPFPTPNHYAMHLKLKRLEKKKKKERKNGLRLILMYQYRLTTCDKCAE